MIVSYSRTRVSRMTSTSQLSWTRRSQARGCVGTQSCPDLRLKLKHDLEVRVWRSNASVVFDDEHHIRVGWNATLAFDLRSAFEILSSVIFRQSTMTLSFAIVREFPGLVFSGLIFSLVWNGCFLCRGRANAWSIYEFWPATFFYLFQQWLAWGHFFSPWVLIVDTATPPDLSILDVGVGS